MRFLRKLEAFALDRDIYGHKIEVHYQGKSSYNTWLGLACTVFIYGIVFQSMIVLGTDFINFSRQEENINIEKFDRHDSQVYNLTENGMKFYLLPYVQSAKGQVSYNSNVKVETLRPSIGYYQV